MADDERQDQPAEGAEPEGQEPEGQEPEGQEPEGQEPEGQEPEAEQPADDQPPAGEQPADPPAGEVTEGGEDAPGEDTGNGEEAPGDDTGNGEEAPGEDTGGGQEAPAESPAEGQAAPAESPGESQEAPAESPAEGQEAPAADAGDADQASDAEQASAERAPAGGGQAPAAGDDVIPGAHLEPDLVLEEERQAAGEGEYADTYAEPEGDEEPAAEAEEGEQPVAREPLDLAADARYSATGKRKTAVARVILKPGDGVYTINGRHLDQFFPRVRLQRMAQQPLETAGYNGRMDVVARIHGGGVSAQAGALRHGIARALVEADPNLRVELKRRGFLTRDPREKERKKAGLKKARKRPQFSKR